MKQKAENTKAGNAGEHGFTLIEMLVVISIMGLLAAMFIANFVAFRGPRDMQIATNQLVTNLREIQSYTLSSRNSPATGKPVIYYMMELNAAGTSYQIQSIDSDYTFESAIQNINLPNDITIAAATATPAGI